MLAGCCGNAKALKAEQASLQVLSVLEKCALISSLPIEKKIRNKGIKCHCLGAVTFETFCKCALIIAQEYNFS